MIDPKHKPQAQRAADLFYTLLGAVEDCGADPELTNIVIRLSSDHQHIRALFGLDPSQVVRVIRADDIYPLGFDAVEIARYEAYRQCRQRGHDSDYSSTTDKTWYHCKFCGTQYRNETRLLEENAPEVPA